MENRPSAADEDSGTKRGRRGLDRSGNHGKSRVEKRAGELDGGTKPVQWLANNAEHVREGSPVGLVARNARGRPGTRERAVSLRASTACEGAAHNRGDGVVAGDGFASIERNAQSGTSRGEECRAPCENAGKVALPEYMLNRLPPLATRAAQFGKYRAKRMWTGISEDAAAQEPNTIVSDRHHDGALLVVKLGDPQKFEMSWTRKHRRGRGVLLLPTQRARAHTLRTPKHRSH